MKIGTLLISCHFVLFVVGFALLWKGCQNLSLYRQAKEENEADLADSETITNPRYRDGLEEMIKTDICQIARAKKIIKVACALIGLCLAFAIAAVSTL